MVECFKTNIWSVLRPTSEHRGRVFLVVQFWADLETLTENAQIRYKSDHCALFLNGLSIKITDTNIQILGIHILPVVNKLWTPKPTSGALSHF